MIATPYILMLEDDVVAQDGWYHRTQEAIASAERQMKQIGAPNCELETLLRIKNMLPKSKNNVS